MFKLLLELIRKDLKVFVADRKAMIISFAVPVAIASFMGMLTSNMDNNNGAGKSAAPKSKIQIALVDEDNGPVAADVLKRIAKSDSIEALPTDRATAQQWVNEGRIGYGIVLTKGFSQKAVAAMQGQGDPPELIKMSDPSKAYEAGVAEGTTSRVLSSSIVHAAFGDVAGSSEQKMPYVVKDAPKTAQAASTDGNEKWSGIAHSFAGMAIQGLLFWSIESAMGILRERRQGIWRRLRAAPVGAPMLLLGKVLSGALRALMILAVVFGSGAILFHMRVQGSVIGFALVALAASFMAATFGLFVAALGRTEQQSRGLSILAVLTMTMLGGAWFPSFLMPGWVQSISLFIPVRWAVDGFDSMLWRAQDLQHAMPAVYALLGFAVFFGVFALKRIRWEYEA
ncbi:ABC transporter permease [Fimbriimonas ginsengisoli]|uniref:ABC-2 type transporter n=1 Tax=Fimbriimonas ginsengisoli Gsoil 348 TaxID=661478 RepID=A0A068NXD5_FIMGI|nr:ABC transporter permease [Fimbriimonas ginsengisoli]AIE88071.1 ABC-2 type transporter [Fimbriimonas ginsengisoli Gsoil 348]